MKTLAIILCILYQGVILKPLITVLDFQIRKDYIITYICEDKEEVINMCSGQCYLDKELNHSASQKDPLLLPVEEDIHLQVIQESYIFGDSKLNHIYYPLFSTVLHSISLEIEAPPPQLS